MDVRADLEEKGRRGEQGGDASAIIRAPLDVMSSGTHRWSVFNSLGSKERGEAEDGYMSTR